LRRLIPLHIDRFIDVEVVGRIMSRR
jgi:hypothetical protein